MRDFFQLSPEGIFKADAGLVSINHDGTFNDRGFHQGSPENPPARYRYKADSEEAEVVRHRPALMRLFVMADTAASGVVMCKFHCEGGCHGHPQTRCRYAHRALENGSRAMAAF